MRFPYRELHGLGDAQNNFEALEAKAILDNAPTNFLQLLSAQTLQIAFGRLTLAWTASNLSANVVVAHGLGRTPQLVLATAFTAPAAGEIPALNTFTYTTTQFSINGDVRTSGTFNCAVNWIAVG